MCGAGGGGGAGVGDGGGGGGTAAGSNSAKTLPCESSFVADTRPVWSVVVIVQRAAVSALVSK